MLRLTCPMRIHEQLMLFIRKKMMILNFKCQLLRCLTPEQTTRILLTIEFHGIILVIISNANRSIWQMAQFFIRHHGRSICLVQLRSITVYTRCVHVNICHHAISRDSQLVSNLINKKNMRKKNDQYEDLISVRIAVVRLRNWNSSLMRFHILIRNTTFCGDKRQRATTKCFLICPCLPRSSLRGDLRVNYLISLIHNSCARLEHRTHGVIHSTASAQYNHYMSKQINTSIQTRTTTLNEPPNIISFLLLSVFVSVFRVSAAAYFTHRAQSRARCVSRAVLRPAQSL